MMNFRIFTIFILSLIVFNGIAVAQSRSINVNIKDKQGKNTGTIFYAESHALVIGISDYKDSAWKDLPGVKKDVVEVKKGLKEAGFQVHELINPGKNELREAMENFIAEYGKSENNRLLFYFAGHGHTVKPAYEGNPVGYLVMADSDSPSDEATFKKTALSMKEVEVWALDIAAKHALFVFDSCFSGTVFSGSRSSTPPSIDYKVTNPVRHFITSGSADEEVPDQSIFRRYFLHALKGDADLNADGYVTATEVGSFVHENVINDSRGTQTPQSGKINQRGLKRGDFLLKINLKVAERENASSDVQESEMWDLVKESDHADDLEYFLKEYPMGKFANHAKLRIRQLKRASIASQSQVNRENLLWQKALENDSYKDVAAYLRDFPTGKYSHSAYRELNNLYRGYLVKKADMPEMLEIFRRGAEQNDSYAQYGLGRMHGYGAATKVNIGLRLKYFQLSSGQDNPYGHNGLGALYTTGEGVTKNYPKAFELFSRSAEMSDPFGQGNLAKMYLEGRGTEKNYRQALYYAQLGAKQGSPFSMGLIGKIYREGLEVDKNESKAQEWFRKEIEVYRKGAQLGSASAHCNLGDMYRDGRGVEQSDKKAVEWYRKAADQNYARAQTNLGWMYENGRGVEQSDQKAVEWYRKAAEQNKASAQTNLGWMYENGRGEEQSDQKAAEWYRKAAEQGFARAQNNLGVMYENGEGVEQSDKKAVEWYRKAADQNYASAQNNLGVMYENGEGVKRDKAAAYAYYSLSAEQNNDKAIKNLKELKSEMNSNEIRKGERKIKELKQNIKP